MTAHDLTKETSHDQRHPIRPGPRTSAVAGHATGSFTTDDTTDLDDSFFAAENSSVQAGVWKGAPARFEIDGYPVHELMSVLSGSVTITDGQRWGDVDAWNRTALDLHDCGGIHRIERDGFRSNWRRSSIESRDSELSALRWPRRYGVGARLHDDLMWAGYEVFFGHCWFGDAVRPEEPRRIGFWVPGNHVPVGPRNQESVRLYAPPGLVVISVCVGE
jgi:uncharacterized cupin superfamily protein